MASRQKEGGKDATERAHLPRTCKVAGCDVDGAITLGRNPESSSGPTIRNSFAEAFKQTFKMSHPFPEHHHFGA